MRKAIKEVAKSSLKLLPAVEKERNGPPVDEVDVHHRTEAAGFDISASGAEPGDEFFVEGLGDLWRRGLVEGGTPALPAVAVEGELGDDEERAACVGDGEIHLAVAVLEYTEGKYLVDKVIGVGGCVVLACPQENENTLPYLADGFVADVDPGFFYTLDYCAHGLCPAYISVCWPMPMHYNMD